VEVHVENPFPEHAVPRIWTWTEEFRWRVSDDFGPKSLEEFMSQWAEASEQRWAVYRDGDLGGLVTASAMTPIVATSHCLFKKSFWGQETTLPALRQVYQQVFGAGFHKILSFVFRDNKQIIGLARKLGAAKEGVLRKQTLRRGKLVDMVALGLLQEDFEQCLNGQ
jgi:RimJ/RimL family protein N-acetyltransferase